MTEVVCIDTDVISCYLIPNSIDPDWEDRNRRANSLFDTLKKADAEIYLPSIALMELLFAFPDQAERQKMHKLLLETFRIASFDPGCANFVPDLLFEGGFKSINTSKPRKDRAVIKEDAKILATALNLGCKKLYTNNKKDFVSLAGSRITIISLDDIPIAEELPFPRS